MNDLSAVALVVVARKRATHYFIMWTMSALYYGFSMPFAVPVTVARELIYGQLPLPRERYIAHWNNYAWRSGQPHRSLPPLSKRRELFPHFLWIFRAFVLSSRFEPMTRRESVCVLITQALWILIKISLMCAWVAVFMVVCWYWPERTSWQNYEAVMLFVLIVCGAWIAQRIVRHLLPQLYESPYEFEFARHPATFSTRFVTFMVLELGFVLVLLLVLVAFHVDWEEQVLLPLVHWKNEYFGIEPGGTIIIRYEDDASAFHTLRDIEPNDMNNLVVF